MASTYGRLKVHFGTGYSTPLPEGWKLTEAEDEWAIGTDPDGQDYFLGPEKAYPRRIAMKAIRRLKKGDPYIDTARGVVSLVNADAKP